MNKKRKVEVEADDLTDADCTVCFRPREEMLQCANGHPICRTCRERLPKPVCPTCEVEMKGEIRCLVAEKMYRSIISKIEFSCENKGCTFSGTDRAHERTCPHRHFPCPLCLEHQVTSFDTIEDWSKHHKSQRLEYDKPLVVTPGQRVYFTDNSCILADCDGLKGKFYIGSLGPTFRGDVLVMSSLGTNMFLFSRGKTLVDCLDITGYFRDVRNKCWNLRATNVLPISQIDLVLRLSFGGTYCSLTKWGSCISYLIDRGHATVSSIDDDLVYVSQHMNFSFDAGLPIAYGLIDSLNATGLIPDGLVKSPGIVAMLKDLDNAKVFGGNPKYRLDSATFPCCADMMPALRRLIQKESLSTSDKGIAMDLPEEVSVVKTKDGGYRSTVAQLARLRDFLPDCPDPYKFVTEYCLQKTVFLP